MQDLSEVRRAARRGEATDAGLQADPIALAWITSLAAMDRSASRAGQVDPDLPTGSSQVSIATP